MRAFMLLPWLFAVSSVAGWDGPTCLDLDGGKLSPKLRWLQTERLRGALMHGSVIQAFPSGHLHRVGTRLHSVAASVTLRGQHVLLITPQPNRPFTFTLKAVAGRPEFSETVYALFAPSGKVAAMGRAAKGKASRVAVPKPETGDYVLLLNPGVAFDNTAKVSVAGALWSIDGNGRPAYESRRYSDPGTPLQMHILRDMKLAGMNTLMLDFRFLPCSTDAEMRDWTHQMRDWADFAGRCGMHFIPAVNLGGTKVEVKAWGDVPPGLYPDPKPNLPVAPCPLQKSYWENLILRRGREVARASLQQPAIAGLGIDPEMYACWAYGHYMAGGTCFCDHCLGGFLRQKDHSDAIMAEARTGKARLAWIRTQGLEKDWDAYLEEEMLQIATWIRRDLQSINPDFCFAFYVTEIGNWFCRGMARGLGTERVPLINFAEGSYWPGFTPRELRQVQAFKSWGAHVIHGGGLYPGSHPPTKPGYLGASLYNFALQTGGYWIWPMDYFLGDWQWRNIFEGDPGTQVGYWLTLRQAGAALDARMRRGESYTCALDGVAPHPIWNADQQGRPQEGIQWKMGPAARLRLARPAQLYFGVPKDVTEFAIVVEAPEVGNGARVTLYAPDGSVKASVQGELGTPERLEVKDRVTPGVWMVAVRPAAGLRVRDIRLIAEGVPRHFAPAPESVLMPTDTDH